MHLCIQNRPRHMNPSQTYSQEEPAFSRAKASCLAREGTPGWLQGRVFAQEDLSMNMGMDLNSLVGIVQHITTVAVTQQCNSTNCESTPHIPTPKYMHSSSLQACKLSKNSQSHHWALSSLATFSCVFCISTKYGGSYVHLKMGWMCCFSSTESSLASGLWNSVLLHACL